MQKQIISRATSLKNFLVNSPASKDTAIVYISTIVAAGIGFLSSLIIARELSTASFGFFTAYNAIVMTAIGLTDLGLGTGLIRFATPLIKSDPAKARGYFKAVLLAEVAAGLLVLLPGMLFAGQIAALVGHDTPETIVRLAVLSAAVSSTGAYVTAVLNTHKKFKLNAALLICINLFKLLLLVALLATASLTIVGAIAAYTLAAVFGLIAGFTVIPKSHSGHVDAAELKTAAKKLLGFSGWLTLSYILNAVASRLDFFYLYRLRGPSEAGVYAAAIQLSIIFTLLLGAVTTVMTPYISEKISHRDKILFLRKTMALSALGALALMASALVFPLAITILFGAKYADAAGPLRILIIHFALNLLILPISLMFIPLNKVKVGTFVSAGQLAIVLMLYPVLIRQFGANGAALTVLVSTLAALVVYPITLAYFLSKERRHNEQ